MKKILPGLQRAIARPILWL